MSDWQLEEMVEALDGSPDYRVLRRYRRPERYHFPAEGDEEPKIGLFIDLETTGLRVDADRIIELGLVPFEFSSDGRLFRVLEDYDELEDPGRPIPAEVVDLTGITDEMVRGHAIDDARVEAMVESAAIVIAHNAVFDRKFAEARWPIFEKKAWACSLQDIPWRGEGFEATKLEYLAYRFGFFYNGHRAVSDCLAGIELLSRHLPRSGAPAMRVLLDRARKSSFRIFAENAPFEAKDTLRGRGYRWNTGGPGQSRCWFKDISPERLEDEVGYLRNNVYRDLSANPTTKKITAFERYSTRA